MWVGLTQSAEDVTGTKMVPRPRVSKDSSCLAAFELGHWFFPCFWTQTEISVLVGLKPASRLAMTYTVGSPESPACWLTLQVSGLLSLYSQVIQFTIMPPSLSLIYLFIYFSLKHPHTVSVTHFFVSGLLVSTPPLADLDNLCILSLAPCFT